MPFTPKTPYLTTDTVIEVTLKGVFQGIVLIERKNPPLGLALPGGFVDVGERVEEAAVREMREEVSLDVTITALLGVYSDPSRDPRFHTASVVYLCQADSAPVAADDAKAAAVYALDAIPLEELVFDHRTIVEDYLRQAGFESA